MVSSFFVYGTLKRGQCRDQRWPATPLSVGQAWTNGQLYTRPDYPAMIAGDDPIVGERWTFAEEDVACVVEVLDRIEGVNPTGQSGLYRRVISTIFDSDDQNSCQAYIYLYETNPEKDGFTRVTGPHPEWP